MTHTSDAAFAATAQDAARAMDQALDWLIVLGSADEEQTRQFHAWLAADPLNAEAFAKAQAIWDGPQVAQCAQSLAAKPASHRSQAVASALETVGHRCGADFGLSSFSNLPMRLQADHLTVVGERQALQLEDGSKVLLNTNSAFSSSINERQRVARLYQGASVFRGGQPIVLSRWKSMPARCRPAARHRIRRALSGRRRAGQCAARRCRSAPTHNDARSAFERRRKHPHRLQRF